MKNLIVFCLIITSLVSAQSKRIKGYLFIKDSVCVGKDKPYKVEINNAQNVKIFLSTNEYNENKYIGRSNDAGTFKIIISETDFKNYSYLIFSSGHTRMKAILINSITDELKLGLEKGNSYYNVGKPALYLYPKEKTELSIELDFKGVLGTTFPLYKNRWEIIADPNGEIENKSDKRKYNYLFWEGDYAFPKEHFDYKDGFVVKNENLVDFFISKLSHIGLNNTEINDFIVYWLPQLEKNDINFIHFWINDNIDNSSFLNITPNPETTIVVYFEFKRVDKQFKIQEQVLPSFERKGFTMVEWGGSNLTGKRIE